MDDGRELQDGLDLSGGWHDAGDNLKFTITTAYSAYTLLKGYDAFPNSYEDIDDKDFSGNPNGIPDILDEVKIGTDWLIKAHYTTSKLISRIGEDKVGGLVFT
jgi:endoglucanase